MNVTPFHGAIRSGDWKLIHNGQVSANATSGAANDTWELFNLRDDPAEQHELSGRHPDVLARLKQELAEFAEASVHPNIPPNNPPEGFRTPAIWGQTK